MDIDGDDGVDVTWSEPPGLGSIPDELIVIETWSEPPGPGFILSGPRLSMLPWHLWTREKEERRDVSESCGQAMQAINDQPS